MKKFLSSQFCLLLTVTMCAISPAQQARIDSVTDRIINKALTLGEAKLDKALGLPVTPVK